MNKKAICLLLAAVIALTGCGSSMVVGKAYDGIGSHHIKILKSYADFTEPQEKQIDSLIGSYQHWHRTTQLSRYADFLRSMITDVESADSLALTKANEWWETGRAFADDMRECSPFNGVTQLLVRLSHVQVNHIAINARRRLNKREDKYRAETPEDRMAKRMKEITKWGNRTGFSFNDAQADLLRKTLEDQASLGAQRYELRRIWVEEFILLLKSKRKRPEFKDEVTEHIDSVWRLTQTAFPDEWQHNEKLWISFIKDYINLQTKEQRAEMFRRASSMAKTLDKLSAKKTTLPAVCYTR